MQRYFSIIIVAISISGLAFVPKKSVDTLVSVKTCEVNLTGTSPATDVAAVTKTMIGVINLASSKFVFKIKMNTFEFENKSMQDHYNEKYLETEKYKYGTFSGTMDKTIDVSKNNTTNTNIKGTLEIHGVQKVRTIPVSIKVENKKITITTTFNVNLKEHNIEVPSLVFAKIGEDIKVDMVTNLE
ncbi:MAG: YceI family protein [Bacteroidota bacterium]|nr:YceI family protein [Bacteroidota bacterium]